MSPYQQLITDLKEAREKVEEIEKKIEKSIRSLLGRELPVGSLVVVENNVASSLHKIRMTIYLFRAVALLLGRVYMKEK